MERVRHHRQPAPRHDDHVAATGHEHQPDIGPDLDQSNYRFTVQRRSGTRWRTIRRTQTLGAQDVSVINLARGRYRVVVPRQHDLVGARAQVRLRR